MDEKGKTLSLVLEPETHQKPGRPKYVGPRDVYGLVGGDAYGLQPKKRLQRVLSLWKSTH